MNVDHESRVTKNICNSNEEFELRKGPWTLEEDNLLIQYIDACGDGRWNALAKCAGLKRTGKSCRLRWLNYLKPDIRRGNLTPQEQLLILELHSKWGNRWSKIAQNLPGRTDNEIKNYWRTRVQKQARQLKVDANSKTFLETLKFYWMPRLLEKVDQSNALMPTLPSFTAISPIENQDSTFSHFSKSHEILTTISSNSRLFQNNVHQEKSNLPNYSNNYPLEYQKTMSLPELQENVMELSPSWKNNNYFNSSQSDCYSTPNAFAYTEECLNQHTMTSSSMGCQEMSFSEYHITQNDCFNYEQGATFWNTDDLWQYRNTEEY
ncbi:hypothetical protein Leryth_020168 [Lithospermum erythrorhizon]|nr:hypothetical protein Leryth_020168 [Lithospermum erythrorhizon]